MQEAEQQAQAEALKMQSDMQDKLHQQTLGEIDRKGFWYIEKIKMQNAVKPEELEEESLDEEWLELDRDIFNYEKTKDSIERKQEEKLLDKKIQSQEKIAKMRPKGGTK